MKTLTLKSLAMALLLVSLQAQNAAAQSVKNAVRDVAPAVVIVVAIDENQQPFGFGTGFFIKKDGLVVSNYHVVKGAYQIAIRTQNEEVYEAIGVVDFNPALDYVVLRVSSGENFPSVRLQSAQQVEIGDEVIAIGHPKGLDFTISTGIISQIRHAEGMTLIQHTAPISPGNSGGPLFTRDGKVIGINTLTMVDGQNLNFAIPIDYIQRSIQNDQMTKYTVRYVATWQKEQEEPNSPVSQGSTEIDPGLAKYVAVYKDPNGLFAIAYPRGWKVERDNSEDQTVYVQSTMFAPANAYRAEVDGYLSEGMRVMIQVAKEGRSFTMGTLEEYGKHFVNSLTGSNSGFALTSASTIDFNGQPAKLYAFAGQGQGMPEPEKTLFVILANEKYRVIIELVSPASKLENYAVIYAALMKTFTLGQ